MVKTLLGLCLLLCGLGIPAWALPASDSSGTNTVAQDGTGAVWALPVEYGSTGALRRWQSRAWVTQTVPDAAGFRLYALTRGGDGAVYAFWQHPRQWQRPSQGQPPLPQCLITVQRGISSRTLARFSADVIRDDTFPNVPTLYAGSEDDVWLAGDQPLLQHLSRDGSLQQFPITREQLFNGGPPENFPTPRLASLADGMGRRWFWQGGRHDSWQQTGLRGVLIWDGKTLAYHATLSGVSDRPISVVAPLDKDHLWVAVRNDEYFQHPADHGALYRLDTRTLSAVPVMPPRPDAFQNVTQVFQANGDWYVVDRQRANFTADLWRNRAGHWQNDLHGLEETDENNTPILRSPWLAEPSGTWLGTGRGAWWLPRNDAHPLFVNWRRGLSSHGVNGLYPLTDGGILAGGLQSATRVPATPQPIQALPPSIVTGGMGAPAGLGLLIADPRRHLWGIPNTSVPPRPLCEWDGRHWRTHLPPKDITAGASLYACDTLGRIWLATSHWNPPAQPQPVEGRVVYDPSRDTWTNYDTVPDALRAAAMLPGMGFLPYHFTYQPPLFSGDGRVTYTANTTVFLYDGQTWRHWKAKGILPSYDYDGLAYSPDFNHNGVLEVVLKEQIWEWTPESGWARTGVRSPEKYVDPVPPDGPHGLWGIPVVESLGMKWFLWQGAVYTAWHGLWAKQNNLSAPGSPFRAGYSLQDVLRDPLGRVFFVTRPGIDYDLVIWSPPPVPSPKLTVIPTGDDAVMVRVRTQQRGRHWLLWRLNGGEWSAPQTADTFRLTTLPHGDYRLEVQILDDHLQASPSAIAVFSIRVASDIQIARWVHALLGGTEAEREAAVAGLVKQPDTALPALRAVPVGISETGRWWIDAAIQQVQAQKP